MVLSKDQKIHVGSPLVPGPLFGSSFALLLTTSWAQQDFHVGRCTSQGPLFLAQPQPPNLVKSQHQKSPQHLSSPRRHDTTSPPLELHFPVRIYLDIFILLSSTPNGAAPRLLLLSSRTTTSPHPVSSRRITLPPSAMSRRTGNTASNDGFPTQSMNRVPFVWPS